MDFNLSEERQMLADTTNRYIHDQYEIATRHKHAAQDGGFDKATWLTLADLGLIGALLPPDVGGLGGLLIGNILVAAVQFVPNFPLESISIPRWAVILSLGFSAVVGIIFGMGPAIKASVLNPIDALRHE